MPGLKQLNSKIKEFRKNLNESMKGFAEELKEANKVLKLVDDDIQEKIEVTEDSFRVRQLPPENFVRFRSRKLTESITAVIGFKKEGGSDVQSFIFKKSAFTIDKVKKWLKDNNAKVVENAIAEAIMEDDIAMRTKGKKHSNIEEELKEDGITRTKEAQDTDLVFDDCFDLSESDYDVATGELRNVVFIEAGTNVGKRRHYPQSVVEAAAPSFSGLKMYLNHQTKAEEKARPERDIREWASTITESIGVDGKAIGTVSVHDTWLRERLSDPVFRQHVGLSINMGGKASYGRVNGQEMQIIEKIVPTRQNGPGSVDWVTEAGARGRIGRLIRESNDGRHTMELHEASFEDLKRDNPDLLKSVVESVKDSIKNDVETIKKDTDLKEAQDKNVKFEKKEKLDKQLKVIKESLKEAKNLPNVSKDRIQESLMIKLHESDSELKESIISAIKKENDYLASLSNKGKINLSQNKDNQAGDGLRESLTNDLTDRSGLKDEKKKDKDED